jgi:phosphomannomutase / phosphoglucomutase
MLGGETLSTSAIHALRTRIEGKKFSRGAGTFKSMDIIDDYIARVTGDIKLNRPMKIVVDCGNGVAGAAAPQLLRALGCEVHELFCEVDGNFPNHHPDPGQPENLRDLIKSVKDHKADIGLAFDGDGDRLGVVDSNGGIIWPDRQMMLYATDVLSRCPGAEIIYDVKCSNHLDKVITAKGGRPLMWKTGHSLIKAKLKETGDPLAGEMSGHIFFNERWYGFDDGLYTAARLLEILAQDPRPSVEVFAALPNAINTPELNIHFAEGEHFEFMDRLMAGVHFPNARITTIDGIRADFDDGWGLVRASNTTPSLVLRFEANNTPALKRIQGIFKQAMQKIKPELEFPF